MKETIISGILIPSTMPFLFNPGKLVPTKKKAIHSIVQSVHLSLAGRLCKACVRMDSDLLHDFLLGDDGKKYTAACKLSDTHLK